MKVSELTPDIVAVQYLRMETEDLDETGNSMIGTFLTAAKDYAKSYTGLSDEEMDEHADITIAVACLAGDMYSNRNMISTAKGDANQTVMSILNMHTRNLVPKEA